MKDSLKARWITRLTLPTMAAALAVAGSSPAAMADPPSNVTCGMVLTQSVTLQADLQCAGDALIVGADGITIDLAGHSVSGNGTGKGISAESHSDLTVRDGSINGFATGVGLIIEQNSTFTNVKITGGVGLFMQVTTNSHFTDDVLRDTRARLDNAHQTVFDGLLATNVTFTQNECLDTTFQHSRLIDSSVRADETDRDTFSHDSLVNSPIDFGAESRDWLIEDNLIRGAQVGVRVTGDTTTGAHIIDNLFLDNELGVQVTVNILREVDGLTVSDNAFLNNGAAGLLMDASVADQPVTITVSDNLFLRNGFQPNGRTDHAGRPVADGAHFATAAGSTIEVTDNLAIHNAAFGIFAEPGTVVDGGGNKSVGDPLGCLGVVCS
jgi:hypothetical protein